MQENLKYFPLALRSKTCFNFSCYFGYFELYFKCNSKELWKENLIANYRDLFGVNLHFGCSETLFSFCQDKMYTDPSFLFLPFSSQHTSFLVSVWFYSWNLWGQAAGYHQGVDPSESNEGFLYLPVPIADRSSILGIHGF